MAHPPTVQTGVPDTSGGSTVAEFPEPNPQEARLFYSMIRNLTNHPDIDWDGVATDSGFKNAAVAKKRFYQIKQKLGLDAKMGTAATTPKSPRKSKAAKAAASADATAEAGGEKSLDTKPHSPQKVIKRRKQQPAGKTSPTGPRKATESTIKHEGAGDADVDAENDADGHAGAVRTIKAEDDGTNGGNIGLEDGRNFWDDEDENNGV
ncbi:hypothetical protein SPI_03046 [Niveomyces insectorum RCEF 264]|uniref:Myb-like DNA-binding domain-containing protein n=1 Tax=Niveomyces insectorum RCEF 264 TaxID=1081102 RepID=A0A167X0X9_9HYPO|nr:hypothetical protein SPI_03046 [Niveomyces insectorum RCEF 264]